MPDFGVPDDGFFAGFASLLVVDDELAGLDSAGFESVVELLLPLSELFESLPVLESEELEGDEPFRCAFLP